jgi:hypothetical protein
MVIFDPFYHRRPANRSASIFEPPLPVLIARYKLGFGGAFADHGEHGSAVEGAGHRSKQDQLPVSAMASELFVCFNGGDRLLEVAGDAAPCPRAHGIHVCNLTPIGVRSSDA